MTLFVLAAVLFSGCRAQQTPAAIDGETETTTEVVPVSTEETPVISTEETANSAEETVPVTTEKDEVPSTAAPTETPPDGTEKPMIHVGWGEMTEEEKSKFQALVVRSLKELDAEALAPYIEPYGVYCMNAIKQNPEMLAVYQNLMSRITYEDGFITGPSIRYLLGAWWVEHSHDETWAYLSDYAAELFEHVDDCLTVTYFFDMEACLWGQEYGQEAVDICSVFHPLGIDPSVFMCDPATAIAADALTSASGQSLLDGLMNYAGRNMEGYFQADVVEMAAFIEEHQTDSPAYPALAAELDNVDLAAVRDWARDNVIVVYVSSNVYYFIPREDAYQYRELMTAHSLVNPGKAIYNDIQIVSDIVHAYEGADGNK